MVLTKEQIKKVMEVGTGLDVKASEPKPEDWLAGIFSGIKYKVNVPDGNWKKYAPHGESQKFRNFDAFACTHFTAMNSIEVQIDRLIQEGIIETELIKDWLDEMGHFNASDRFNAKTGGNVPGKGNSMTAGPEALRKFGVCPEKMWPALEEYSQAEYYKPIPPEVYAKAKELLNYFDFPYEQLPRKLLPMGKLGSITAVSANDLIYHLKQAPINIGIGICPGWFPGSGIVQACSIAPSHAVLNENVDSTGNVITSNKDIFDSYDPYHKELSWFYPIHFATKIVVIPKNIILKNKINMTKKIILKVKDSALVGLWVPAKNPTDLQAICKLNGIDIAVPVDWKSVVAGEIETVIK